MVSPLNCPPAQPETGVKGRQSRLAQPLTLVYGCGIGRAACLPIHAPRFAARFAPPGGPLLREMWLRGYAPSGRYSSPKGTARALGAACGPPQFPRGAQAVRPRLPARPAVRIAPAWARSGLLRATLRRSIGPPAPVSGSPCARERALLPLSF